METHDIEIEIGPDGNWWAVFLACRPYAPDRWATGRETFLLPVKWTDDGWPQILPPGERVPYIVKSPTASPAETASSPATVPLTGNFTADEAKNLATLILSGALPLNLTQLEVSAISATLGVEALDRAIQAGIIGVALVMLFMLFRYRLCGLVADIAAAAEIPPVNLVGKTSLKQLAQIIREGKFTIGGDTGPVHLSAGLHQPTIMLMGPTDANRNGPYGQQQNAIEVDRPCKYCWKRACPKGFDCLANITVEQVKKKINEVL